MSRQTLRHLLVTNQGHGDHNLKGRDPELIMESLQIETPAKDGRKVTRRMREKKSYRTDGGRNAWLSGKPVVVMCRK